MRGEPASGAAASVLPDGIRVLFVEGGRFPATCPDDWPGVSPPASGHVRKPVRAEELVGVIRYFARSAAR